MSKQGKKVFVILGILLVAMVGWLASRTPRHIAPGEPIPQTEPANMQGNPKAHTDRGATLSAEETVSAKVSRTPGSNLPQEPERAAQMKAIVEAKNVPIDFWGRVVDQHENPIPGAKIVMRARQWLFMPAAGPTSTSPKVELSSDGDGRFEWHGQTGDSLTIEGVEKEGFKLSPHAPSGFSYGQSPQPFTPDPSRPVIIRMWQLGQSDPTISNRGLFGFVPDGRLYTLDLIKNTKTEGRDPKGQITVKFTRPSGIKPQDRYPWRLEIAAVGGGVMEATDEFLFEAPQNGYQPVVVYALSPTDPEWTSVLRKQFYFRFQEGQIYGAMRLTARPDYAGESAIQIESSISANGSRNLQR